MRIPISYYLKRTVKKGDIRNTIFRQIKVLERAVNLINEGKTIKQQEIDEYSEKNPEKAVKLKKQVNVMTHGIKKLENAIEELKKYKSTTVTD